jgi:large conductance mechanosensitive channel
MKIVKEFKEFATKGNVVDMAVGIIIGAAFGKIVSSLVSDVLMPPLGILIGGVDFKDLTVTLQEAVGDKAAVTLNYGNFVQTLFDFIIVAFTIFVMIKAMNRIRKPAPEQPKPAPEPSKEEIILGEIRDMMRDKK